MSLFDTASGGRMDSERNLMWHSARFNPARVYTCVLGITANEPVTRLKRLSLERWLARTDEYTSVSCDR